MIGVPAASRNRDGARVMEPCGQALTHSPQRVHPARNASSCTAPGGRSRGSAGRGREVVGAGERPRSVSRKLDAGGGGALDRANAAESASNPARSRPPPGSDTCVDRLSPVWAITPGVDAPLRPLALTGPEAVGSPAREASGLSARRRRNRPLRKPRRDNPSFRIVSSITVSSITAVNSDADPGRQTAHGTVYSSVARDGRCANRLDRSVHDSSCSQSA